MTSLKRSFFSFAFYLAVIFTLGQADYMGRPIINFASYFYLAVMVAVPITLFFPSKWSIYVPTVFWGGVYVILLDTLDRSTSTVRLEYSVIVLEFILLELGVWLAYQLAVQIGHAESVIDKLALSAFPNNIPDIEQESQRIKVELSRSRRYHRPVSVIMLKAGSTNDRLIVKELLKSVQNNLANSFALARIGQILVDQVRQVDQVLRDHRGHFIILCPETDLTNATLVAKRIVGTVRERMELQIQWGVAFFPEDALTFDDLLQVARNRMLNSDQVPDEKVDVLDSYWLRQFEPSKRILTGNTYLLAKRAMDLLLVLLTMPIWLPLMGIVALAVLLTSSSPVFFVQPRTGKGGKRFYMYKFRTMVKNAEALKKDLAKVNENGELAGPLKLEDDPRITPIGKILRKTSLDELPQLVNVLLGDMSLVGPRPTSWSPESYKLWHTERLDVLPGVTGLFQVFGRGGQDFDEWLRWDIAYIEREGLWFDISILFKTVSTVLTRKGAR